MKQTKLSKEERQKYINAYEMIEKFISIYQRTREKREKRGLIKESSLFSNKEDNYVTYSLNRKDAKLYSSLRKYLRGTFKNDETIMEIVELFPSVWYLREKMLFNTLIALTVVSSCLIFKYTHPFLREMLGMFMVTNITIWIFVTLRLIRLRVTKSVYLLEDIKRLQREIEEILNEESE